MTLTLAVQVLFGARVPVENERDVANALGAKVGEPQPDVEALGVLATVMAPGDVGKESVKLTPLIVSDVEFVIVNVSVDKPPATVELGEKAFEMVRAVAGSMMFAMRALAEKSLL